MWNHGGMFETGLRVTLPGSTLGDGTEMLSWATPSKCLAANTKAESQRWIFSKASHSTNQLCDKKQFNCYSP